MTPASLLSTLTLPGYVDPDSIARGLIRFDAAVGRRSNGDGDAAATFGAGASFLKTVGGVTGCLYHGIGDASRHAVGIETWAQAHLGEPSLGWGSARLGVVLQSDWYLRESDCGS